MEKKMCFVSKYLAVTSLVFTVLYGFGPNKAVALAWAVIGSISFGMYIGINPQKSCKAQVYTTLFFICVLLSVTFGFGHLLFDGAIKVILTVSFPITAVLSLVFGLLFAYSGAEPEAEAKELVALRDCPIGPFLWNDVLCAKTEYFTNEKYSECYTVFGGEIFWGDAKTYEERDSLMVQPVKQLSAVYDD